MNWEEINKQAREIVLETGDFIRNEMKRFSMETVEQKGKHEYVSYVDKTSEERLINALHKVLPKAGFIAEEGTATKRGEQYNWIIDPLDGTTNYIHGLPPFSISVGLTDGDEIINGVVYEIIADECFYAWKNSKAYLNGKVIHVSKTKTVNESLIATGFPYRDFSKMDEFMESMQFFMKNSHGLRRCGSAAVDLAYVACGRYDAFYEYSLYAWDVAAGAIIVKQAGGKIADFKGGENWLHGQEIIAANSNVFNEFTNQIKQIMYNHT